MHHITFVNSHPFINVAVVRRAAPRSGSFDHHPGRLGVIGDPQIQVFLLEPLDLILFAPYPTATADKASQ